MMIAKYYDPDFAIPMNEWSELTGFEKGKGSWASAGLLWFANHGYEVHHISLFDWGAFLKEEGNYLIRTSDKEAGEWQIRHTNMAAELKRAQELLAKGDIVEFREPTEADIKNYLDQGFLLRIHLNYRKLVGRPGYVGHAVLVFDYDSDGVYMHDPGSPPIEGLHVAWKLLEAAMADPTIDNKDGCD